MKQLNGSIHSRCNACSVSAVKQSDSNRSNRGSSKIHPDKRSVGKTAASCCSSQNPKKRNARRLNGRITGQGMTEYIIIVALIALASIVSINLFGNSVRAAFGGLASVLGGGDSTAAAGAATAASGEILNEAGKARKLDGYEK